MIAFPVVSLTKRTFKEENNFVRFILPQYSEKHSKDERSKTETNLEENRIVIRKIIDYAIANFSNASNNESEEHRKSPYSS